MRRSRLAPFLSRSLNTLRGALRGGADRGASAVEYGLMVAAIAAVIVGLVFGLGGLVKNTFSTTSSCMSTGIAANGDTTDVPC